MRTTVVPKRLLRPWTQKPPAAEAGRPNKERTRVRTLALRQVAATRAVVTGSSRRVSLAARAARYRKNELDETARQTVEFLERPAIEVRPITLGARSDARSHLTGAAVGHDR
jgi:hypothetical protein